MTFQFHGVRCATREWDPWGECAPPRHVRGRATIISCTPSEIARRVALADTRAPRTPTARGRPDVINSGHLWRLGWHPRYTTAASHLLCHPSKAASVRPSSWDLLAFPGAPWRSSPSPRTRASARVRVHDLDDARVFVSGICGARASSRCIDDCAVQGPARPRSACSRDRALTPPNTDGWRERLNDSPRYCRRANPQPEKGPPRARFHTVSRRSRPPVVGAYSALLST